MTKKLLGMFLTAMLIIGITVVANASEECTDRRFETVEIDEVVYEIHLSDLLAQIRADAQFETVQLTTKDDIMLESFSVVSGSTQVSISNGNLRTAIHWMVLMNLDGSIAAVSVRLDSLWTVNTDFYFGVLNQTASHSIRGNTVTFNVSLDAAIPIPGRENDYTLSLTAEDVNMLLPFLNSLSGFAVFCADGTLRDILIFIETEQVVGNIIVNSANSACGDDVRITDVHGVDVRASIVMRDVTVSVQANFTVNDRPYYISLFFFDASDASEAEDMLSYIAGAIILSGGINEFVLHSFLP